MRRMVVLAAAAALAGCQLAFHKDRIADEMTDDVARSVRRSRESQTLSSLAALERSLNDFIRAESRIPARLDDLVPKYLGEVPSVELGIPGHKEKSQVAYYPSETILDGQINGSLIEDTGGWGYAYNENQIIIFVDCTHKRLDGSLWYKARGVY